MYIKAVKPSVVRTRSLVNDKDRIRCEVVIYQIKNGYAVVLSGEGFEQIKHSSTYANYPKAEKRFKEIIKEWDNKNKMGKGVNT